MKKFTVRRENSRYPTFSCYISSWAVHQPARGSKKQRKKVSEKDNSGGHPTSLSFLATLVALHFTPVSE